jgi:hypothetical protein
VTLDSLCPLLMLSQCEAAREGIFAVSTAVRSIVSCRAVCLSVSVCRSQGRKGRERGKGRMIG